MWVDEAAFDRVSVRGGCTRGTVLAGQTASRMSGKRQYLPRQLACAVVALAHCLALCAIAGDSSGPESATGGAHGTRPVRAAVPWVFRLPGRLLRLRGGTHRGSSGRAAPPPTGVPRGRGIALRGRNELERGGELVEGEYYNYQRRSGNMLTVREKGGKGEDGRAETSRASVALVILAVVSGCVAMLHGMGTPPLKCAPCGQVKFVAWSCDDRSHRPSRCIISFSGKRKAVDPSALRPRRAVARSPVACSDASTTAHSPSPGATAELASAHALPATPYSYTTLTSPSSSPCASPSKGHRQARRSQESIIEPILPGILTSLGDCRRDSSLCAGGTERACLEHKYAATWPCSAIRGGSGDASSSSGWSPGGTESCRKGGGCKKERRDASDAADAGSGESSASSWETALTQLRLPVDVPQGSTESGARGARESEGGGSAVRASTHDSASRRSDLAGQMAGAAGAAECSEDDVRKQLKTRLLQKLQRRHGKSGQRGVRGAGDKRIAAPQAAHGATTNITTDPMADDISRGQGTGQKGKAGARGTRRGKVTGPTEQGDAVAGPAPPIEKTVGRPRTKGKTGAKRKNDGVGAAADDRSKPSEVAGPSAGWFPRNDGSAGEISRAREPQADAAPSHGADQAVMGALAANASAAGNASRAIEEARLKALFQGRREHGRENVCTIVVDGDPVALKRPRHRFGGHTYDPNYRDKKKFVRECQEQLPAAPLEGAIALSMLFELPRAKMHFSTAKKTLGLRKETAPELPVKVPDLDNLVKFVLDALNEHLFVDDKQICEINARKCYRDVSGPGRTVVHVCHL
jgi:Holliday junction resolvase RusA-like endonuclease